MGDAVMGYTKAIDDVALLKQLGVDSYRFSMEWARIEPKQGMIRRDGAAALLGPSGRAEGGAIRPLVTLHHFSNPAWLDGGSMTCGGNDQVLCGIGSAQGGDAAAKLLRRARAAARAALRRSRRRVGDGQRADQLPARGLRRRAVPAGQVPRPLAVRPAGKFVRWCATTCARTWRCTRRSSSTTRWTPMATASPRTWGCRSPRSSGSPRTTTDRAPTRSTSRRSSASRTSSITCGSTRSRS